MKKEWFGLGRSSSVVQLKWVFACVLIVSMLVPVQMYAAYRLVTQNYTSDINVFYRASALHTNLGQCDEAMASYLRSGNRASLARHNEGIAEFKQNLEQLAPYCTSAQELSLLRSIKDAFYSYQSRCNFAAFSLAENEAARGYESLRDAQTISEYLGGYCSALLDAHIAGCYHRSAVLTRVLKVTLAVQCAALLLLGGLVAIGIYSLVGNLDHPLARLYEVCLEVAQGNYGVAVPEAGGDSTMLLLARTFNTMTGSIRRMVSDLEEKKNIETQLLNEQLKSVQYEKLLEQAHFLALQTQTNPHFLFNTLNAISRTVTLGRGEEAVGMIGSLAQLLRYNLQDATTPATLAEEMSMVAEYLKIQQCRFPDRFRVVLDYSEPDARRVYLPRFTLQPIVENAVLHGLEPKLGPGLLQVTVCRLPDGWHEVRIRDDGPGMAEETLRRLTSGQDAGTVGQVNAIGVFNTRRRLEIFTQCRDVFLIESRPGEGTLVRLRIPPGQPELLPPGKNREDHHV